MSDILRGQDLYEELHKLAQTEGNEPIRCSRMHFSEWADDVDKLNAEIERLRGLLKSAELENVRAWHCFHVLQLQASMLNQSAENIQDNTRVENGRLEVFFFGDWINPQDEDARAAGGE